MRTSRLNFRLDAVADGSLARAASFQTLHNEVLTPVFMPVGTQATVKAQLNHTLEDAGSQILLANTYHLLLRPGTEVFRRAGGIHGLMSWTRSVLTDSGGYQIFSLPHSRSMTEAGAVFRSYLDGRSILLSPEVSIDTQRAIGSDIMMALDQCVSAKADGATARAALGMTHRWAARSLAARGDSSQSLFAIVQGALFPDLRLESVASLSAMPFDGFAIGGLAVGESKRQREDICEFTARLLPEDRPRYLMGVGTPLDVLEAVHRGVDMFDCIIPTQLAQRGGVFTSRGILQMRRSVYKFSTEPLDRCCACATCARYSRAYLHHLTKTGETTGWHLLGLHNIHFYHQLMRDVRESIVANRFMDLYHAKRAFLQEDDLDNPTVPERPKTKGDRAMKLGGFEVQLAPQGFASIRHVPSGEIMHARQPPMEEARSLYVEQSALAARLRVRPCAGAAFEPLVVWDVGLGAAANAMAAVHCYEKEAAKGPVRPMQILSFENDLDPLRLAFRHNRLFHYLRHSGPAAILRDGRWRSKQFQGLAWTLVCGDFLELVSLAQPPPALIFYDLFSSKSHRAAWTFQTFRSVFAACGGGATELFTYSSSTAVRASLLASGFYVAKGGKAGARRETTIGLTPAVMQTDAIVQHDLLSVDWLARWERSDAAVPKEIGIDQQPSFVQAILMHPQFQQSQNPTSQNRQPKIS